MSSHIKVVLKGVLCLFFRIRLLKISCLNLGPYLNKCKIGGLKVNRMLPQRAFMINLNNEWSLIIFYVSFLSFRTQHVWLVYIIVTANSGVIG